MNSAIDSTLYFAVPGDINSRTGGYGYDRELIKELAACGFDVQLLTLSREFPKPSAAAFITTAQQFAALPDGARVIVDGLAFAVLDELAEREKNRLMFVALCHHPLALETGVNPADAIVFEASETRALAAARAVIVTSQATAKIVADDYAVPQSKITVACPGTATSVFAAADHEVPTLLTVATLTQRKGHDLLIESLAELAHLPWQARFVGGDDFDPAWAAHLRQLARTNQLENRICFAGDTQQVAQELQNADIFVFPSHYEGYGMAVAEAVAAGLPVIATAVGAAPSLISADSGIVIPPGDKPALTRALHLLLTNLRQRIALRDAARRAAQALPTWQDCAKCVAQLLLSLNTPQRESL